MEKDVVCRLDCPWFRGCLAIAVLTVISVLCPLFKMKKKSTLLYPNIPSAIRPVPHGNGLPIPEPLDNFAVYSDDEDSVSSNSEEQQPSASRVAENLLSSNHKIIEGELNNLIRNLKLPKRRQNFWHQDYNSRIYYTAAPQHIKLWLKKNFVKALDVKCLAFMYLCGKFPRLTFEKVKTGVFIGPQFRQLFKNQFDSVLSDKEKAAWQSFEKFSNCFLGNFKAAYFRELVQYLVDSYIQLECNMSLKMHFYFYTWISFH
jgi:hypothetical protein